MIALKTLITCILGSLLMGFTTVALAVDWNYSIIVDAGSSGSRLYLFRYHTDTSLPTIEDISVIPNKTNEPLASFDTNPTVIFSLDSLFNAAITTLQAQGVDPKTVPVSLFGTAGMRLLLLDKQQLIYNTMIEHLKTQYSFTSITAKTISGKEEGIYDWLDVNYLANNFTESGSTLGSIDIGGASMEMVFATKEGQSDKAITLIINGQTYTVYSNSVLGLGQDEALKNINLDMASASCYPAGSLSTNDHFDFNACNKLYSNVLNNTLQQNDKPSIPDQQKFIAFGSVYYVFKFFAPAPTLSQITLTLNKNTLEKNINIVCTTAWQALKEKYPTDNYLSSECANGIYIDELLFGINGYQLQGSQLEISNVIDQKPIGWPLGALLYQLIKHPDQIGF